MTETAPSVTPVTVGVSDLTSGTMSQAEAQAAIESLKSDRDFGKLLLTKIEYGQTAPPEVLAAKSKWDTLLKLAHPAPREYTADEIQKLPGHHDARRIAEMAATRGMEMLAQGYSAKQVHEILGRRPIPQAEHDFHEQRYQALKNSPAFMRRWSERDPAAILEINRHISGRRLPVARSLADIEAWDARHPFKPYTTS
jgi:hypothetical protein